MIHPSRLVGHQVKPVSEPPGCGRALPRPVLALPVSPYHCSPLWIVRSVDCSAGGPVATWQFLTVGISRGKYAMLCSSDESGLIVSLCHVGPIIRDD